MPDIRKIFDHELISSVCLCLYFLLIYYTCTVIRTIKLMFLDVNSDKAYLLKSTTISPHSPPKVQMYTEEGDSNFWHHSDPTESFFPMKKNKWYRNFLRKVHYQMQ